VYHSVKLPVRLLPQFLMDDTATMKPIKLRLLAERAGLDLRRKASGAATQLTLPDDFLLRGRMLPAARFIVAAVKPEPGEDEETACTRIFNELFQGVGPGSEDQPLPPVKPVPTSGADLSREIVARTVAWEWCERVLKRYRFAASRVLRDIGKKTDDDIDADAPAETLTEGAIVKAHFKAKGKDGKTGKSRKPRESRVQSMNDDLVTVQFLSNACGIISRELGSSIRMAQ